MHSLTFLRQTEGSAITHFHSLSAAGFAATAVSYGPARMGFGLFVPEFKATFSMSDSEIGLISSLGFMGFFAGLCAAMVMLHRKGPEHAVLSGLVAATAGLTVVAIAPNTTVLAIGVALAAASAGFAWTPFNDAVHRNLRAGGGPAALSEISTGTSAGIALAGAIALAALYAGLDWRICWGLFAAASAGTLAANRAALRRVDTTPEEGPDKGLRDLLQGTAVPLFAIALVFGVTSAVYLAFAAERFESSGGVAGLPASAAPALVFICYGLFGLSGLATGRVQSFLGLPLLLRLLMVVAAASLALAAFMPNQWIGLVTSAGLQGVNVMMTSAALAFWSERLFPGMPAFGFTAALLATAIGNVLGPALAGYASTAFGPPVMFLGTALAPLAIAAFPFGAIMTTGRTDWTGVGQSAQTA